MTRPSTTPRVLFLVNSLDTGGAEKQVLTLLDHLDTRDFQLSLACLKGGEELLPQLDRARLTELACCGVRRRIDGRAVHRLRQLITRAGVDVMVCTNLYPTLYGQLAVRRRKDAPRLVTVFHTTSLRTLKEKSQMLLYRRLLNRCDRLIYVCETQRRYWRERGVHPPADDVVHNGIDARFFEDRYTAGQKLALRGAFGFDDGDYVVGLCCKLRPEKAPLDLLHAIVQLRAQGVPAKALLIGDGPERPLIERGAAALGLSPHVRITGMQQDVRPYIACCDVMALVSRHIETFSLAALEAMALGKPLVMSDLGGAREQVIHGEHGFIFEPGDTGALARHLAALTARPLRERLGAAAARRIRERFTVETMAARFADCIARVAAGGAPPASRATRAMRAAVALNPFR